MKHKKLFILVCALVVLSAFGVVACGSQKEEGEPKVEKQEELEQELPQLVGIDEVQPTKEPEEVAEEEPEAPNVESPQPKPETTEKPSTPATSQYSGDTGNQELNELCDNILNSVITSNMNERQKLKAVYDWVESKIRYSGSTAIGNWRTQAITILKTRKGNCVAYCYASQALLTRMGVENVQIQTSNQDHFWNMVKYDGNWYHWDTTQGWGTERFLWTTSQIKNYTYRGFRYSEFDESKYPTTP